MIFLKYFLTLVFAAVGLWSSIYVYRIYDYFQYYIRRKFFSFALKNVSSLKIKMFRFDATPFKVTYSDIKNDERLYNYWILTMPTVSIYIRSLYNDVIEGSYGLFIFFVMLTLFLGLFLWAYYDLKKTEKYLRDVLGNSFFDHELNEKELSSVQDILGKYQPKKALNNDATINLIDLLSDS